MLRMGAVHLTVASLERSLAYYAQLGLRDHGNGVLGCGGEDLLILTEEKGAATSAGGYCGLFHFALLLPTRADLGAWLGHAIRERIQLTGASDHAVSEALYLRDPDGHGIEIYADRPRKQWEGKVAELITTIPLDVEDLLGAGTPGAFEGLPAGTVMGHVHLRVREIDASVGFYMELGFELMARYGSQAAFLGSGGYHHHVGVNVWESEGAPLAPEGTARLTQFEILSDAGWNDDRADSSGIAVALR